MIKNLLHKIDDSAKQISKEFIEVMDDLLSSYSQDEYFIYESVGITESDYMKMQFTKRNFLNALNMYLKRKEYERLSQRRQKVEDDDIKRIGIEKVELDEYFDDFITTP